MPLRNLYLRAPNGSLELLSPRNFLNGDTNVFDKAFNGNNSVPEEFDDWMRWEGGAAVVNLDSPIVHRPESLVTDISSPDGWAVDVESADTDITPIFDGFPFEDAPFELDDNPQALSSQPSAPLRPLAPTRSTRFQDTHRSFHGFSSLSETEEQHLKAIAMPNHIYSNVTQSTERISPLALLSPSCSASASLSPSPSPEPAPRTRARKAKNKKRKAPLPADDDDLPTSLCQSRKRGHNAIEKRYRTNLNDKISCLREGIPSLRRNSSGSVDALDEAEDSDGSNRAAQQKYGKAAILTRALEYIKHLERTTERLGGEVTCLKGRVDAFEGLASGGKHSFLDELVEDGETLQSIQDDFQQIKQEPKPIPSIPTRRSHSKSAKSC